MYFKTVWRDFHPTYIYVRMVSGDDVQLQNLDITCIACMTCLTLVVYVAWSSCLAWPVWPAWPCITYRTCKTQIEADSVLPTSYSKTLSWLRDMQLQFSPIAILYCSIFLYQCTKSIINKATVNIDVIV